MKRPLVVAVLVAAMLWAPPTLADRDGDDDHDSDHESEYSNRAVSKCPSETSKSSSYAKCNAAVPFSLGGAGVVLPSAFCQARDCYSFLSGLSSTTMGKCLSGYSVGGVAVSNASGMKECFAKGGVLATSAPAPAPASVAVTDSTPTSAPASTTIAEKTVSTEKTANGGESKPETASSAVGDPSSAGAPGSPTSPTHSADRPSTSTSSATANDQRREEDGGESGSGDTSSGTTTRIVKKTRSTSSGAIVEELVIEDEATATMNSTTAAGPKRLKSNDASSQSGSSPNISVQVRDGAGMSPLWIAVGSVGGIVVVIAVFLYLQRRQISAAMSKKLEATAEDGEYFPTLESSRSLSDSISILGASAVSGRTLPSSRLAFWDDEIINAVRIPYEKLELGTLLSRGGYGEVHRGLYRDQHVAIKSLLPERRKDMRQIEKFLAEVKLMAVLEHDHIVRFVGVAWDSLNELCVVSEFMPGGDLRSLLAKYKANEEVHPKGFKSDKIKMAMHIAHALTYMHSLQPVVLHRDLKSRNILLDADLNAKLTDFGISRERADSTMTIGVGSSLWMAPEVMTGGHYDEKADVFSFGVVLSELDTQMLPYAHALEPGTGRKLPDTVVVQMMTTGRISVQFTNESESRLAQLGRECVALDPEDRPSAAEVQHRIHQLWRNPDDSL